MKEINKFLNEYTSKATLFTYHHILNRFSDDMNKDLKQVTPNDVKKYFHNIVKKHGNISRTSRLHQIVLCNFFRQNQRKDLHDTIYHSRRFPNPDGLTHIRTPNVSPLDRTKMVSDNEYNKLLDVIVFARDEIILRLLMHSAVRINELCNIRVKDIDFHHYSIFISKGKGKFGGFRERYISTLKEDFGVIKEYISKNNLRMSDTLVALGSGGVRKLICSLCKQTGIRRLNPHMFRHSAITRMFEKDMPIERISAMVGTSVDVLRQTYIHTSSKFVTDTYSQYMEEKKR